MFNYNNLIGAQQRLAVASKISCFYDPIDFEIHSDSVFVHYENNNFIRLFSKQSLLSLHQQLKECRQVIKESERDKSFIKLALHQHNPRNEEEVIYKEILRDMLSEGYDSSHLMQSCELIDTVIFMLVNMPANSNVTLDPNDLPQDIIFIIHYITHLHQLRVNQQEELDHGTEIEHQSISAFLFELILLQTAIIEESRRKLLSSTGEALEGNQIICPYTRSVINVEQSLASASKAKLFLKLIIAVANINHLQIDEIDSFLKNQKSNYLQEAYQALNDYINNPSTTFTLEQQKFLAEIGVKKIVKTDNFIKLTKRYQHLWSESQSFKENTLAVLNDYSKLNAISPAFNLFMTCHWDRHHHHLVKKAIWRIKEDTPIRQVVADLDEQAKANPNFNRSGSLARRLEFINLHLNELNSIPNKIFLR